MRILIAEDEVATARALKLLLEKAKYAVDIVHSGTDAWDYISAGQYDVIVLDIMMPGMSGLEVLSRIRQDRITTPVLLLTAKAEIEDRITGLDAGADDYLPKPFATGELIANNIERQKQFITDASHELKTPLTSISTSVDVIAMEHGEDEWTENIRQQTGRMTKLVSELVALSRLDEEIPLPNKEHFSLSDAAEEITEVYAPQAKAHEKEFTADIQENISLFGEKAAVQQMLSVLLDNAVRYSDEHGCVRFSVMKKHGKAHIEVFNTCRMETPPDVDRLFDRFYRPDSSRSTASGGTGIGLAIAKAVAQTHGGTIRASCPSGQTMTITVII